MTENPVSFAQAAVAFVTALVVAVGSFGVDITAEQRTAIIGLLVATIALVAFVASWWARRRVTPLANPKDDAGQSLVRSDGQPIVRKV